MTVFIVRQLLDSHKTYSEFKAGFGKDMHSLGLRSCLHMPDFLWLTWENHAEVLHSLNVGEKAPSLQAEERRGEVRQSHPGGHVEVHARGSYC